MEIESKQNKNMETKKRPISMRMTQEQFDSIKDRINLPINSVTDFGVYGILINFDNGEYRISNVKKSFKMLLKGLEYHETFNADIFLEACGVEVEKVWKYSEMQVRFKKGVWCDFPEDNSFEYRVKPQPNYEKEIEALQEKAKLNGMKAVVTFEKL